ncbi:hypothetical protein COCSADRAFT_190143 [Bipolaris sorokiniana ND90Pr]|uniref:AB hydrolase-1 domain-containing protein n=1 Tax=Cochliobolus sativus (strain ND90Pr / ATCC 201652) TaxID=665912 RepID=M2REK0_COCSN|nr:uncharacterized protein COCSADRAFT_190143 [Bipolaris sorokiniana ND90Pr]EMD65189.1 hypothetical protein COCSADRAFT_190143 [Bipolaris sorokiniana ND90Pr]
MCQWYSLFNGCTMIFDWLDDAAEETKMFLSILMYEQVPFELPRKLWIVHHTALLPYTVRIHPFTSLTPHSCAYEYGGRESPNALVYIGGLTSGPQTSSLVLKIDSAMENMTETDTLSYSVFEFRMRSSYTGFGYSSLKNDVEDLAALVRYLKGESVGKEKVVLMGSSTGCQAIMTYATTLPASPPVNGYILQAPTSDRETASLLMPPKFLHTSLQHAEDLIAEGKEMQIMPSDLIPPIFSSPISAYRWHSLVSVGGDDDFFSSDLPASTHESSFGRLGKPTLIIVSGKDEIVPPNVDKEALLKKWVDAMPMGLASDQSGVLPDADHELTTDGRTRSFMDKACRFLKDLEKIG